jgi:putative tryptophan/tyrosine transport system substrate-binding protein
MKKKIYLTPIGRGAALFVCIATAFLLSGGCTVKPKVYRIGVLSGLDYFYTTTDGFKEKMTELGYIEGKNIVYDVQRSNINMVDYERILKKFVADKVDLIFVFPTEASQQAKAVTAGTNIPVVFANVFIEGTGLVKSVTEPGGNMTGVRWPGPDIALQRFEIMRELLPNAKRLWVPYFKDYPIVESQLEPLRQACGSAGIMLTEIPVTSAAELAAALPKQVKINHGPPDAILHIAEPISIMPDAELVECAFADKYKIPIGGPYFSIGEGCESVFGLLPQYVPQGRQAAVLADKIFKGASVGTLPVVSAEYFFQFNYRRAQKLGLKVNEGLLSRADEIIR